MEIVLFPSDGFLRHPIHLYFLQRLQKTPDIGFGEKPFELESQVLKSFSKVPRDNEDLQSLHLREAKFS